MQPGTIISAHNVLSTVPVAERHLSTCFMPPQGVTTSQVRFRVLVNGLNVYEGPGSPATPTCVRVPFPRTLENGAEVRVQAWYSGSLLAEDVYRHEDVGQLQRTVSTVERTVTGVDWGSLLALAVLAAVVWFLFQMGSKKEEDELFPWRWKR